MPPSPGAAQRRRSSTSSTPRAATAHRLDMASGYNGGTEYLPFPGRRREPRLLPDGESHLVGRLLLGLLHQPARRTATVLPEQWARRSTCGSKSIWVARDRHRRRRRAPTPATPRSTCPGRSSGAATSARSRCSPPARATASGCESGLDCCGGSCTMGKCGVPQACAATNDKCTPTVPCCNATDQCLGGYCGVAPPK